MVKYSFDKFNKKKRNFEEWSDAIQDAFNL